MNKAYKILSIEAKDIVSAMRQRETEKRNYSIRSSDGKISLRKFTNAFDYSLDSIKLEEVYKSCTKKDDFSFVSGRHRYTQNVICVTFKYSYKEYNMAGKNTFVKDGYTYRDCVFRDGVCIKNGELIAIQTNVEVKNPIDDSVLGKYFTYANGYYEQVGSIKTLMDKSELREYLYENGFMCDGIEFVRYKRSSGSSRVGKCLFVNKILSKAMEEWDKCGINVNIGDQIDLAAWEAYISLPMSSIIDTIEVPLNSILVIDDYNSTFDDEVVAVEIEDDHLVSSIKNVTIENSIFDGQSLMDASLFGKYSDKGMLLLRNRFFKSCCFNTNLQQWFADNDITEISQLSGFTLAERVTDIKLITTPSSIKYAKFGTVEKWLHTVEPTFGIVKYEKPPHKFDGRMVQAHYQLFNTLQLSYDEMENVLAPSLSFIKKLRTDPAVLRYHIRYPDETNDEWTALDSRNEIVFKLMGINDKFTETKMYQGFRDDLIKGELRNLKRGHVLVNGNYSTIMGNGLEMLKASIGLFSGESELGVGNIHSKRFPFEKRLLCSRSPHVTVGNVLLVNNVANETIDKYFNLTKEIVCINAIGENIQQRLNGCDYDSDTILITDNQILVDAAEKNYSNFMVPTNMTSAVKTKRYYTQENKADLDVKTSVNKIGEIINLSQQLNSLMWEKICKGASIESCMPLYCDICKLAVLSNIEIDKAKREYVVQSGYEINVLKKKYKISDDEKTVKPFFFKMITTENGFSLSNNIKYRYFDTPMDYLQKIISRFNFREGRERRKTFIPFMDIVSRPSGSINQGYYYAQRDKIIDRIRAAREEQKKLFAGYDLMSPDEKTDVLKTSGEIKQDCIEEIEKMSSSPAVMYAILKYIDKPEYQDISRFVFEVLFGRPDQEFFKMIQESKDRIYTLHETPGGMIDLYGFKFNHTLIDNKMDEKFAF